ncbi:hypothetical protein V6N13_099309 [Hibiscus sabdariffa]|uniref:Uncharacterized protein n=1 Tax=Hibiscus sabdariffa TaxID=183260 RepID=A0ABR2PZA1_9ROSI
MHLWISNYSPFAPHPRFPVKSEGRVEEIRVCTNRTCRRQGSLQTLQTLTALAPPDISVKPCSCLGSCGARPNVVLLPHGQMVRHCSTSARAAELMVGLFSGGGAGDASSKIKTSLDALALRMRAEALIEDADFFEADRLLSQAYILQGDAFLAMNQYDAAQECYATCLWIDPSIRRSKSFKIRIAKLEQQLAMINTPHDLNPQT